MTLPGRLSIACIEEDNPLKSYFRLKPLLVSENDRIELMQDASVMFPSQGFVRIVPDKNEMSLFKNRMHLMGRYCVLDLRRFPGENEKIRPNKNFSPDNGEHNAFMVYSDVVFAPAAGLLTQVLDLIPPQEETTFSAHIDCPSTPCVALRYDGRYSGPWKWTPGEEGSVIFTKAQPAEWNWSAPDAPVGICINIEENTPMFVNTAALERHAPPSAYAAPIYPRAEAPVAAPVAPVAPAAQVVSAPVAPAAPAPAEDSTASTIPLTTHRAINARITMREQALLAQMGVSPRRGRSLYEIVDEKWRKSRIDQLGHPVPLEATGSPANDPIENAMTAIRAVLPMQEARASLIEEMLRNETLNDALTEVFGAKRSMQHGADSAMTEIEAERLALSAEVDKLRQRRETEKELILEELRAQYAREFAALDRKKEELRSDIASLRETEASARTAAEEAVKAMKKTIREELDEKLVEGTITGRARRLIAGMNDEYSITPPRPVTTNPNASELISDVRAYFDRAARPISNDEAVNMLACLTLSRSILLSGPVGSGKRDTMRLLAGSIGISTPEYQRYRVTNEARTAEKLIADGKLVYDDDTISAITLLNANSQKDIRYVVNSIYGAQIRNSSGLRLILSIDDAPDAYPVSTATYDRSYLIRLEHKGAELPWRPADARPVVYGEAVSLEALNRIFTPKNDLPVEMELRMTAIRERLDKLGTPISRRSLDALWRYCSAVLPYMQCSPMELLDLAISQRGLPTLLSCMPIEALMELPDIFKGMDKCLKLLDEPLPLPALY
ncbi:MAG: hypothetical protein Q4A66_09370 [Eubacteriales bacterium]|nr:hypothetical protein [Eubacteriales bacterium]